MLTNLDLAANVCGGRGHTKRFLGMGFLDKGRMHVEAGGPINRLRALRFDQVAAGEDSMGQRRMAACARLVGPNTRYRSLGACRGSRVQAAGTPSDSVRKKWRIKVCPGPDRWATAGRPGRWRSFREPAG